MLAKINIDLICIKIEYNSNFGLVLLSSDSEPIWKRACSLKQFSKSIFSYTIFTFVPIFLKLHSAVYNILMFLRSIFNFVRGSFISLQCPLLVSMPGLFRPQSSGTKRD